MASMKILVAEDENSIAKVYQIALQSRGHEVTITNNGLECWKEYQLRTAPKDPRPPYDAVILDYRMPEMNGFQTAKKILKLRPKQRIIFASAFMKQTLVDAINKFGIIAELLHKPFEVYRLIDSVEDTYIYSQLQSFSVNIGDIKSWNPSHEQLSDLLDALLRLKDPKIVFPDLLTAHGSAKKSIQTMAHDNDSVDLKEMRTQLNTGHTTRSDKSNAVAVAIIEESLQFLGSEWLAILYYHLSKRGISKENIVQNPSAFLSAVDQMFEGGSSLIKARILQIIEANKEIIDNIEAVAKFSKMLSREIQASRRK
jgi:CheY-like chemotaxis protein